MTIGLLVVSLVAQPVWWVGLIREWWTADRRIKQERLTFGSAVYSDKYEVRHFVLLSILFGLISSVISLAVGLTVPTSWWIGYTILALVAIIIGLGARLPITLLVGSVVLYDWFNHSSINRQIMAPMKQWGFSVRTVGLAGLVILSAGVLLLFGFWLRRVGGRFASPKIFAQKRGKLIAGYPFNELLVIPTLVFIPGDFISSHLAFWPVLSFGNTSVTPLFLPLLIGLNLTIFKQAPKTAFRKLSKSLLLLGLLILAGGILSIFVKSASLIVLGVAYICYLGCLIRVRWHDRHQSFWFSKVDHGVRVLGIRPDTPAAKMDIQVGDIITECNQLSVHSENSLYEALLSDPTYCHLKVQTPEGDLKVTETAIFDGAPHEIGIVVFKD
ncbi:PDZ domain-containing protein [Lactobacillus sp. LC28-10]|uniref:PDZ domain-containing protein n=1 Tax=Secundilactobacillus angelensis TaxID=2722706 RepID=A0ABX1KX24_9LACO|nr:PDZ domain-containing protein [Secundilactobacillus angelensis]MCH5462203.1 PDZ domain-containing protein [Secundilactobacillus angelensis]NLR18494.1 PDZ domain-containing protein [Secundilactobacillus angelensis]